MLMMEADTRNDPRTVLQFIKEDVIGGGYKTLEFNYYETVKVMRDPEAEREEDMSYKGSPVEFENAMSGHPELFALRLRETVDHIYFFPDESRCVMEVML